MFFDNELFITFFELDPKGETKKMNDDDRKKWLRFNHMQIQKIIEKWAKENYLGASDSDYSSFAALISYFGTGLYNGYEGKISEKERIAEYKTYLFYHNLSKALQPDALTIATIYFVASHILQEMPRE